MASKTVAQNGVGKQTSAASKAALSAAAFSTFFIVLFICTEIWIVAGIVEWSFVSLLGLGEYGYIALTILLAPLAIWASWKTAVLAWSAERELALDTTAH
ncbi:MAG: hypothetical protein KDJ66_13040 [Nitratireductor sp.]|nr:hypothetical protein [Nitratireductor sp.]